MAFRPPNIQTTSIYDDKVSLELASPRSPLTPTALPSFQLPTSDRPQLSEKLHSGKNKIRDESRKLLVYILDRLKNRSLPPSVYAALTAAQDDVYGNSFAAIAQTVRGVAKMRSPSTNRPEFNVTSPLEDDGDDDEDTGLFATDTTLELLTQLRDVLIISAAQGWQIFEEGSVPETRSANKSPFRISRNRNSLQPSSRRSRSPSPAASASSPELLSQCISILASVILEDCRFQTRYPRPSRPSNSLQALILDVGQFLLHTHQHDPKVISEIGLAFIPAFSTFPPEMQGRLLAFFEDGVMRRLFQQLEQLRGSSVPSATTSHESEHTTGGISIKVDEVQDERATEFPGPYGWVPWSSPATASSSVCSTNAPFQRQSVYYLSSLIPPLLSAVLEFVYLTENETRRDVTHRLYRLVELIVSAKPDAYLDVLEVVAYHAPAKQSALRLLYTFWPTAIGHPSVGKALGVITPSMAQSRTLSPHRHPYSHQFMPWHFFSRHSPLSNGLARHTCHSCSTPVEGFGLMCPFCMCSVHFGCYDYPDGTQMMPYTSNNNFQRVATLRFSNLLCSRWDIERDLIAIHGHAYRNINLFTLCLCFVCCKPLWGCIAQGMRCMSCEQIVHHACAAQHPCTGSQNLAEAETITIDWPALRLSCNEHYSDILHLTKDQLSTKSHEEVSVLSSVLWTQIEILTHGVSSGCIEILQNGESAAHAKDHRVDTFELHRVASWCDALLLAGNLRLSIAMGDYLDLTKQQRPIHGIMYDWSNLVYIASTVKSPYPIPMASMDLLNVAQPDSLDDAQTSLSHPYEMVRMAHLRDILGYELLIHSDAAARLLLSHIHHLGFFTRLDMKQSLFDEVRFSKDTICVFPIPLGLDLSTNVETLAAAVESCLIDVDLSVNETGFLLLTRKMWPSGMATDYSSKRLMRSIIHWILAEDDNLATILRDYVGKQRTLPGVRSPSDPPYWPFNSSSRHVPASSASNGGDYVAARRAMLNRYAVKWLSELHGQDPTLYGTLLYEICVEASRDVRRTVDLLDIPTPDEQKRQSAESSDTLLRLIARLSQASGVAFSVFDTLFFRWLEHVIIMDVASETTPSLTRLFPRDTDPSQRLSVAFDQTVAVESVEAPISPWRVVLAVASESQDGFSRSLQWLYTCAHSGVDIPLSIFERFSTLATEFHASLSDSKLFVESLLASIWLKTTGRHQLQTIIASLHKRLMAHILECLQASVHMPLVLSFIRTSFAACLLLYGSDRNKILGTDLITEQEARELPSRRLLNVRGEAPADPIVIHPDLLIAVESYVTARVDDVACLAAKFLNIFLNESPFLKSFEVDNFVLRNGRVLALCAWHFYDVQRHEVSAIRATFFLRTVVVDSQPLQELLHEWLIPSNSWELRLLAVIRLFRIVLDATNPAFNIEDRQWRSSIIEIFYRYFSALWVDDKEEIRVIADTFASGLLPAHFDAISLCWTESLATSPIAERVKLVSFLIQLRPHFPGWQVLTWDVIIDTLSEDEYDQKNGIGLSTAHLSLYGLSSSRDVEGVQSTNTDPDMAILRGSILLLSLQMLSDGIAIDAFDLQKIKMALAKALGFADVSATPSATGQSLDVHFGDAQHIPEPSIPCVTQLLAVLDAPYTISLETTDSSSQTLLVGSTFVDLCLNILCTGDLLVLPVATLKSLVESLGVIIYKHNFEHRRLRHLQPTLRRAFGRALELMLDNVSYEVQQLSLSVTQAFIKRWPAYTGSLIYSSIEQATKLIELQSHNTQDALVAQAKSFIQNTITTYATNGFVLNLFKRRLDRSVFLVLKEITDSSARQTPSSAESLRDTLLRDTLPRAAENENTTFQIVMNNLHTYIEVIHHQGYSGDLMTFVGQHLTALTRRALDLAGEGANIDPAPLLMIPSLLIQHNKANSRDMLVCIDTILRGVVHRLNVDVSSLSRLIHVTASLYRKTHHGESGSSASPVVLAIFEMVADSLRLKTRTLPSTLRSMLETLMTPIDHIGSGIASPATTNLSSFMNLVDHGFYYLHNHAWADIHSEDDFYASLAVARMILQATSYNNSIWGRLADKAERSGRPSLAVRSWNVIVLAVLLDTSSNQQTVSIMFDFLSAFSMTHHAVLRAYTQTAVSMAESATSDINHAYIAIKLWLLLAHRKSQTDDSGNATALTVWNELWPPFEAVISALEADFQLGLSMTTLSLTWSTVAELFIFLRCSHTPLALETSSQVDTLNRLRSIGAQDSSMNKIARALKILSEPPPDIGVDILVNQAIKDIVAAEKVRILEARRDASKATQGR
ncbi:hypothetical protein R3P38DRAFT_2978554 [Favolaschia claudopus]|uniref:Phorbol-ester/DAG-type domain-containing protein n=1 Tax=Favolaschia claudopus TaxID=2862362 RepID=A0AAW0B2Q8_9AGAR